MIPRNASKEEKLKIFIQKANKLHNGKYDYTKSIYNKTHEKMIITCKVHGDFEQTPNVHLNGKGCPKCGLKDSQSHNNRLHEKTKKKFLDDMKLLHPDLDFSEFVYVNINTKGTVKCKKHGKFTKTGNHLKRGQGCPECAKERDMSKGEFAIKKLLEDNSFEFVHNYVVPKSKYLKNKPYDFFVKELNLLIEYQGEQHFKKKFNMSDEDLNDRLEIDKKKKLLAKKYGYDFVAISYKDDINEVLNNILFND